MRKHYSAAWIGRGITCMLVTSRDSTTHIKRHGARCAVFVVSIATLAQVAVAQQPEAPFFEVGIDPAALVTRPTGSLVSVRGATPCSEEYEPTTRVNPSILARVAYVLDNVERPMGSVALRGIRLSVGFDDLSSDWDAPTERYPAYNDASGTYVDVETQYASRFDLKYLRTSLELEMSLGRNLGARVGPSVSMPLSASSLQQESIISPSSATFADRTQMRELAEGTGAIDDAGVRVGASAGVSYRLPLGRRLFFEPNIGVDFGFTNVQPDWSPLELRIGIAVGYAAFSDPPPAIPEPVVVERLPEPTREAFDARVDVRLASDAPIELRRQIIARYIPIIPVVFFDENGGGIPSRYRSLDNASSTGFNEQSIAAAADLAHRDVLNVLGARLRSKSSSSITLTGTTSEDETDRDTLSRSRAESVASYFENVWGIARSRMSIRARVAPTVPTSSETEEGREENRRVEIGVSDESILAPVQQRTVEPVLEPRTIEFVPTAVANRPLGRWSLDIGGDGGSRLSGNGQLPQTLTWELSQDDRERLLAGGSAAYQLTVADASGTQVSSQSRTIPLQLDTAITVATSASRPDNAAEFLVITFEFDQARLTERGKRELETIARRVGPTSTTSVTGYTDRIGEAAHNLALARERADRVAAELPKAGGIEVRGADQSEAPYANDSPEGRFLSRTVRVVVTQPR